MFVREKRKQKEIIFTTQASFPLPGCAFHCCAALSNQFSTPLVTRDGDRLLIQFILFPSQYLYGRTEPVLLFLLHKYLVRNLRVNCPCME